MICQSVAVSRSGVGHARRRRMLALIVLLAGLPVGAHAQGVRVALQPGIINVPTDTEF